jgi:hypothetical protein
MVEDFIVEERSLYRERGKLANPGVRNGEIRSGGEKGGEQDSPDTNSMSSRSRVDENTSL